MSALTLLLLQIGFLVLMWFFVFAIVYSLRTDLFGARVGKKAPEAAAPSSQTAPVPPPVSPEISAQATVPQTGSAHGTRHTATVDTVHRIVITSGSKTGMDLPLGKEPITIGRSSESNLIIRDDYSSTHHARLVLWGEQWMIQDLDSTNGTWHDGKQVTAPVPVLSNTPIKVGATTFELRA